MSTFISFKEVFELNIFCILNATKNVQHRMCYCFPLQYFSNGFLIKHAFYHYACASHLLECLTHKTRSKNAVLELKVNFKKNTSLSTFFPTSLLGFRLWVAHPFWRSSTQKDWNESLSVWFNGLYNFIHVFMFRLRENNVMLGILNVTDVI